MLVIVGENDTVVFNYSALPIFYDTTGIPLDQKDYIIQLSDFYGYPRLSADHVAPTCSYNNSLLITDAMDYYSTWKLFDALIDYAFYGINQEYCFNNCYVENASYDDYEVCMKICKKLKNEIR